MKIVVQKANARMKDCLAIRRKVFIEGQKVDPALEIDGHDDHCDHYLLEVDGKPVGTARVRYMDSKAKIQRVAILESHQGRGLGKILMEHLLKDVGQTGRVAKAVLSSQSHAVAFYERLGFTVHGPEFIEAGIPHRDMELELTSPKT